MLQRWINFCLLGLTVSLVGCASTTAAPTSAAAPAPTTASEPATTDSSPAVQPATAPPNGNGAWLGHAYVTTQAMTDNVPAMAQPMKDDYKVGYLFINAGRLNGEGQLEKGAATLPRAADFLNALAAWEKANDYHFKVFAWLNGSLTPTDAHYVDVGAPEKRRAIVAECRKLVSATEPGSYIAGATRAFDGIQVDLEPAGQDSKRFDNLKSLMDEIRAGLKPYPGKLTSFTAHKLGTRNQWWWSPSFYYYMARRVDVLAAMTYDTALTDAAAYRKWMGEQTTGILDAVSGQLWKNDADHPAPTNGVKVLIGFPAFKDKPNHVAAVENIKVAAPAVRNALDALKAKNDPALAYFGGAAVYLHSDGTGNDGFAGRDTDWLWYRQYWLSTPQQ